MKNYDVVIIGGSNAGLSAAMALGRSLRNVLIIDSGKPCNRQTPYSHNFLTRDGIPPHELTAIAKQQVLEYKTVQLLQGVAKDARKTSNGFEVETEAGEVFTSKKLVLATGLYDRLPEINGFKECWGISVIHCPYCHGYEVRNEKTGVVANGALAFDYVKMISHWTKELTLFTNGKSTLSAEQVEILKKHSIRIVESEITGVNHDKGYINSIVLKDNSSISLKALYYRPEIIQHSSIPSSLGCEMTEHGLIKVDGFQQTTVPGVYACGDNSHHARFVAMAVSSGTFTGASINRQLIEETFC